jgi:ABC-type amino acid transport substrate-binding protein
LTVSIRVEAPPPGRTTGDPAHAQKRAFETATVTLVAQRIIGASAKVDLKSTGADRIGPVDRGEVDVGLAAPGSTVLPSVALSRPYATAAIVLAVPSGSAAKKIEDLRGKTIAVAMDELGARLAADAYLKAHGVEAVIVMGQGVAGAADMVASGAAAALIGDGPGVLVLNKSRPGSLEIVDQVEPRSYVIVVRRSSPQLLAEIDKALQALLDSGEIQKAAAAAGFPYDRPR